jgi:Type II secretory pathway, component PulF
MADFWDEEIEAMLDALTSLIEPMLDRFPRRNRRRNRDRDVPTDLQVERSCLSEQEQLSWVVSQSNS